MQARRVPDWLFQRARTHPDRLALTFEQEQWTYAELDREVARAAAHLAGLGVSHGDRVALLARNSAAFAVAIHALARLGACAVPLNVRLRAGEIARLLEDAEPCLLLHDTAMESLALEAVGAAGEADGANGRGRPHGIRLLPLDSLTAAALPLTGDARPLTGDARPGSRHAAGQSPYLDLAQTQGILFTSGTTGRPKGARITFGNHWHSAVASALNLGMHADDRWLACLPLFHIGGLAILFRAVIYGITVDIHPHFDAARVNRSIDRGGTTIVSVVATMLERMLDDRRDRPFPPTLRAILTGGGPVPSHLLERCLRVSAPVVQTYGMTETASQAATLPPEAALRKLGSAGKPLMGVELRVDAPAGELGEILVRGPIVSPGYWRRDDQPLADADGWFRTGDLGRFDPEGYLYVAARRTDLIVSGGENVYPAEVENVLKEHPMVADAAVVAREDARWGQVPFAFVVARDAGRHPSSSELDAWCRQRLAGFKAPAGYRFVGALPRNAGGKVMRETLRAWIADSQAPGGATS